jgi:predicted transcriptional regulator
MARQTSRFDLRLDPELRKAVERIAEARDRSVAWVVRDALKSYIRQEQESKRAARAESPS